MNVLRQKGKKEEIERCGGKKIKKPTIDKDLKVLVIIWTTERESLSWKCRDQSYV